MDCKFAVKVSMLADGELPTAEADEVRMHISSCAECRNMEKDFLFFRGQIKESAADSEKSFKAPIFPSEKRIPFWKRWISVPLPVSALFLLAFIGMGAWLIASRFNQNFGDQTTIQTKVLPVKTENKRDEFSLARYDDGGRAEIYVAPQ